MSAPARVALGACLLALGCGSQSVNGTLVLVAVKSDLAIPAQLDALEISVRTASGGSASRRFSVNAGSLPVELGVVPEGKTSGDFTVTVTAYAAGKVTLTQLVTAAFVPNEARRLEVFLDAACLPVAPTCTADKTCRAGTCVAPGDGVMLMPYQRDAGTDPVVEGGPVMTPDVAPAEVSAPDTAADGVSPVLPDAGPMPDVPPAACGRPGEACCAGPPACNGAGTCTANVCQCAEPAIMCGGSCVNPNTNPNHCRSCNHSCQGGACVSGNCAPVMVAATQDNPSYLTVDDTNLYWRRGPTNSGSIARVPKDGSAPVADLIGMLDGVGALASTGTHLIYFGNRNLWSCPVPTCGTPLRLASTMPTMSLGVDIIDVHLNPARTRAFWTDNARLISVPAAGGAAAMSHLTGNFPSVAMEVDAQFMYYVERDAMNQVSVSKLTVNPPPSRGPVVEFPAASGFPRQMVVTANRLVWVSTGFLGSILLDSPSRAPGPALATGNITRMAVHASTVFWGDFTSAASGRILSCSTTGCRGVAPAVVATTCGPNYLAADATTVYWSCAGTGTVWKVAR